MNAHALLGQLWLATWVGSLSIALVLVLRGIVRRRFGAGVAYAMWWLVPATWLALLLPARVAQAPAVLLAMPPVGDAPATVALVAARDLSPLWLGLWLAGAAAMAGALWWQQRRFVRGLGRLQLTADTGVLQSQSCAGLPALVGVLRPRVVTPADFQVRYDAEQRALMLAHEYVHLRRGDAWVNALVAVLRTVFWCNPLVHFAAQRMRHDQELACDERVVAERPQSRRAYADAMLKTLVTEQPQPLGCHWGVTHPLKERIMMLKQERPSPRVRLAGAMLVGMVGLAAGFAAWSAQPSRAASSRATGDYGAAIDIARDGGSPERFDADKRFGESFTVVEGGVPERLSVTASVQPVTMDGHLAYDIAMRLERGGKVLGTPRMVVRDGKRASLRQGSETDGRFKGIEIGMSIAARDPAAAMAQARPFVPPPAPSSAPASNEDRNAEIGAVSMPAPEYPEAARAQRIGGMVSLVVDVAADGSVADASVERSEPAGVFDAAALKVVKSWKFTPLVKDGRSVPGRIRVPIRFDPPSEPQDGGAGGMG